MEHESASDVRIDANDAIVSQRMSADEKRLQYNAHRREYHARRKAAEAAGIPLQHKRAKLPITVNQAKDPKEYAYQYYHLHMERRREQKKESLARMRAQTVETPVK